MEKSFVSRLLGILLFFMLLPALEGQARQEIKVSCSDANGYYEREGCIRGDIDAIESIRRRKFDERIAKQREYYAGIRNERRLRDEIVGDEAPRESRRRRRQSDQGSVPSRQQRDRQGKSQDSTSGEHTHDQPDHSHDRLAKPSEPQSSTDQTHRQQRSPITPDPRQRPSSVDSGDRIPGKTAPPIVKQIPKEMPREMKDEHGISRPYVDPNKVHDANDISSLDDLDATDAKPTQQKPAEDVRQDMQPRIRVIDPRKTDESKASTDSAGQDSQEGEKFPVRPPAPPPLKIQRKDVLPDEKRSDATPNQPQVAPPKTAMLPPTEAKPANPDSDPSALQKIPMDKVETRKLPLAEPICASNLAEIKAKPELEGFLRDITGIQKDLSPGMRVTWPLQGQTRKIDGDCLSQTDYVSPARCTTFQRAEPFPLNVARDGDFESYLKDENGTVDRMPIQRICSDGKSLNIVSTYEHKKCKWIFCKTIGPWEITTTVQKNGEQLTGAVSLKVLRTGQVIPYTPRSGQLIVGTPRIQGGDGNTGRRVADRPQTRKDDDSSPSFTPNFDR